MLDVGWSELLLIAIVALIVVGPKELPGLFRTVGRYTGKARGMAREFQRSMEQAADESGLNEAAKGFKSVNRINLNSAKGSARKYAEGLVNEAQDAAGKSASGSAAAKTPPALKPQPGRTPAAGPAEKSLAEKTLAESRDESVPPTDRP